jgi:hypothetical protein
LSAPELRLRLADQALRSAKQALALYGLDADKILASVRIEAQQVDASNAQVRTSLMVFDVPLSFEEQLVWQYGHWADARSVAAMSSAVAGGDIMAVDDAAQSLSALESDPVFDQPATPERIDGAHCHID